MKTLKSLFMLCAGLSFCACGSDDDPVNQLPEGNGMVEVKIVAPQTRAETNPGQTGGTTVEVTGDVFVTVVHNGADEWTQKVAAASGEQTVKFYGVTSPSKVTVSMNGGKASYTFEELVAAQSTVTYDLKNAFGAPADPATETETFDMQTVKTVPVYGEATPSLTGTIEEASNGKQYQMYTATVYLKIPVARLEVSIDRGETASTQFSTLTAAGAYLDNLYSSIGVNYTAENQGSYPNIIPNGEATNYYYSVDYWGDGFTAKGTAVSPLQATLSASFIASNAATDVVGFNFYGTPANNGPHFKFIFTDAEAAQGQTAVPSVMYAKIIDYKEKNSETSIALNNGEIYQIIGLDVADSNISMMEDNESDLEFGLTAIVQKANWTIKEINGTWADN